MYPYICLNQLSLFMKNSNTIPLNENWSKYLSILENKTNDGYVVVEQNDKLPFAVLYKERKPINHTFNFIISCFTFGLWSLVWVYLAKFSNKAKQIIVAIDEDGNIFEEKCYMG